MRRYVWDGDNLITVRSKRDSALMKFISFFIGKKFLTNFWTTIGPNTIWAPIDTSILDPAQWAEAKTVIEHELVHTRQARSLPVLWQLAYLLFPLPFLFAWGRWASERAAYLVNLEAGTHTVEQVVDILWRHYGWCWPKPLMRRWFAKRGFK